MSLNTELIETHCAYCGEPIALVIDTALIEDESEEQSYIEDCQVCCRPLHLNVRLQVNAHGALEPQVSIQAEDDC